MTYDIPVDDCEITNLIYRKISESDEKSADTAESSDKWEFPKNMWHKMFGLLYTNKYVMAGDYIELLESVRKTGRQTEIEIQKLIEETDKIRSKDSKETRFYLILTAYFYHSIFIEMALRKSGEVKRNDKPRCFICSFKETLNHIKYNRYLSGYVSAVLKILLYNYAYPDEYCHIFLKYVGIQYLSENYDGRPDSEQLFF